MSARASSRTPPTYEDGCVDCGDRLRPDGTCPFCDRYGAEMNSQSKAAFDRFCERLEDRLIRSRLREMGDLERDARGRALTDGGGD